MVPDRGCVFLLQEQTPWDIASQTLRGTQSTAASRTISQHKNQGVLWGWRNQRLTQQHKAHISNPRPWSPPHWLTPHL